MRGLPLLQRFLYMNGTWAYFCTIVSPSMRLAHELELVYECAAYWALSEKYRFCLTSLTVYCVDIAIVHAIRTIQSLAHYTKPGAPPPTHPVWGPTLPTGEHICVRVCALCQLGLGCAPRGAVRPIRIGSNTSFYCKRCRQLSCPSTWSAAGSLVQPRQQPPPCLHVHQSCRQYAAVRHCAPGLSEIRL